MHNRYSSSYNQADELAKAGFRLPYFTQPGIVHTDAKIALKPVAVSMWQSDWTTGCSESGIGPHMREIRVEIEEWPWSFLPKLETALARLRIGDTA